MGCAPSQSEIIQHLAKNTLRPRKKAAAQASTDKRRAESLTHLVSGGSGNSDSECNSSEDGQNTDQPGKEERHCMEQGYCQNLSPSPVPARTPKLYNEEIRREKLAAGAKMAVSEVIISQRYVPRKMTEQHTCDDSSATQQPKRNRKQKGRHTTKQTKSTKLRARSLSRAEDEEKVDFPTSLVNAHQAAYAYLNPSLSKYDAVLSLTDQAAQTQLILQQMVSFLTLRFDEVNQILEEIASDGERLVQDVGAHLAWPPEKGAPKEQPDLLQQLLQYTVGKLQAANGAVTSVSAAALQETCGYLKSAADTCQQRLAAKRQVDERLQGVIARLEEACARQQARAKPGDVALYSEDSGIGGDTDSVKGSCQPDRGGRRISSDCSGCCRDSRRQVNLSHSAMCPLKSPDSDHRLKGMFHSPGQGSGPNSQPTASRKPPPHSLRSFDSFESVTSSDGEALIRADSMDCCSLGPEDGEEESQSEAAADETPPRPRSPSPAAGPTRPVPKRMAVPQNEEMTIKMKDAISHRIQFVPVHPGPNAWSDEEGGRTCPPRPSSAGGCEARVTKKRRSKSAESLKSQAEDPTLLELQRTQKELNRRMETMQQPRPRREGRRKVAAGPKLPIAEQAAAAAAPPSNRLKASLHSSFSILPSQEKVPLRRNTAQEQAAPSGKPEPAKANRTTPKPGAARLKRNCVQGLIDNFSEADGGPAAGEREGSGGLGSETSPQDFPPPEHELQLATYSLTATPEPQCAYSASDACVTGANSTVAPVPRSACVAGGAAVSRATATRRLLASLESVPLLPSKQPAGRAATGTGARAPRRPQPGQPTAEQSWPPYKIINLRYSGGCCSSPENGPAEKPPSPAGSVPGREGQDAAAVCGSSDLSKAAPAPRPGGRRDAAAASPPCPTPAPTPPALRRSFPGPSLPPRNLYRPAGYTAPSPSVARRNCPNPIWGSKQPNPTAIQEGLSSLGNPRKSSSPLVPRKLPSPLANHQLSNPPTHQQPSSPPTHRQSTSPSTHHQPSSPPTHRQPSSPPTHRQSASPSTHHQPSSIPTHRQPSSTPISCQQSSPPIYRQPSSPPTHRQSASPPTHRQSASPSTHHQPSSAPTQHQPSSLPTYYQPSNPPNHHQLSSASTYQQPSSPPTHQQPSSPPTHQQPSSPPTHQQPSSPPIHHQSSSPPTHHQPSSPPIHRQPSSPPTHHQPSSAPVHHQPSSSPIQHQLYSTLNRHQMFNPQANRQLPSPPTHRQLPSPPTHRQLPSPPTHRQLPSPPTFRKLPSPPTTTNTTSPLVSLQKRSDQPEATHQSHCPGKPGSNASSIFCPLYNSIFESQPPSVPMGAVNATAQPQNIILGDGSPMTSRVAWRNNFMVRQPGDRQRRLTLSGAHPQPFVRKNHLLDFKTGAQCRSPASSSAGSEPALHSIGLDGSSENEEDSWMRQYMSEMRGSSRSVSHPELCIIGQGLQ